MMEKPVVRVLHHMARTGGTVICKCLGSMHQTALLSEVHPLGKEYFAPRPQAHGWFGLLSSDEVHSDGGDAIDDFVSAIKLIQQRADAQRLRLVLRDWTHLDFTGIPFVDEPSYELTTSEILVDSFDVLRTATVRHPLYQLLSLNRLEPMQQVWDQAHVVKGMRSFAARAVEIGFVRYEDFLREPDAELQRICQRLRLPFDETYSERWADYTKITGDGSKPKSAEIKPRPQPVVDQALLDQLRDNEDYRATLELLGYDHPAPLVEHFVPAARGSRIVDGPELEERYAQANKLADEQQWEDAVRCYQEVLIYRPGHAWALNNIGFCLTKLQKYDWAILELRRALEMKPDFPLALVNLVEAYEESGRKFEAIPYLRRLVELEPDVARHSFKLALLLVSVGRSSESSHYGREALRLDPESRDAACNYLMFINYSDRETVDSVAREHFRLANLWQREPLPDDAFSQPREANRRLRIGYVSSDFYMHPVGKIMQPLIAAHDASQFETHCYYSGKNNDQWTTRTAEACTAFHHVRDVSDEELHQKILDDRIDILVDLGGYTGGGNRLSVFSTRGAPVQVSFLGYPNTTALPTIDYRISDEHCDPPGQTDHLCSERTVYMKRGFLCFAPPEDLPAVFDSPADSAGHITFGSFNNVAKISPTALKAWVQILRRTPGSRMRFKYGRSFESKWLQEQIRSRFAEEGVDTRRLEFLHSMPTPSEHLSAIGGVDVALDSFPYQGTMTTLETLTMSVPVITLRGQTYSRRASSALMTRLGYSELVADTVEQYADLAVALANDLGRLRQLRAELRAQFLTSEICDVPAYAKELEEVLRWMWRSWCEQSPRT